MEIDMVTKKDLQQFKQEMLEEMRSILENNKAEAKDSRRWLRSAEVRKMLGISPGTLQNLRINGMLPYKKIGGSIYYSRADIERMMERGNGNG